MTPSMTISVLATVDPVLRASATMNLCLDRPDLVTVTHDILEDGIRRVVADSTGVLQTEIVPLEHACLGCAVREDVIPALEYLQRSGRWTHALVALPVSAEPAPLLRALDAEMSLMGSLRGARYGTTLAIVDADTLVQDAFDETLIADRMVALHDDDDRVMAEALAPLLAIADTIVLASETTATDAAIAAAHHLRGDGASVVCTTLEDLGQGDLLGSKGRASDTLDRANPLRASRRVIADEAGVWTLSLSSDRPFHPERLRANLHRLADHRVRSRGVFWVPSRPGAACVWEGAGRQLSVGECGRWGRKLPRTHLTITGVGDEREVIASAFAESLATHEEVAQLTGPGADALDDWFGDAEEI